MPYEPYVDDRSSLAEVKDPTIKIKAGKILKDYLSHPSTKTKLTNFDVLTVEDVDKLHKEIQGSKPRVYLNELMEGSEVLLPQLEIPPRNPELEARVQRLRNELAEKEYQRMTKNVNFTSRYKAEDSVGYQLKQMNAGLIGVFQFVISIAAAFLFGFIGFEVLFGLNLELGFRLLVGIISALIVGCAELYFLAINLADDEEGVKKPKPKPKVIPPVTISNVPGSEKVKTS